VVLGEQIRGAITSEECRIIEESWSSQPRRSCEITDELGRTWLVYVSQVRDDWGNMLGLLILRTDITPIRKAEAAIRDVNSKVIYAREQEQQRMARDLHDSAAQSLAALKMRLANTIEQYGASNRDVVRFLVSVEFGLGKVIRELREICHQMYPSILEVFGLAKALDGLLDDYRKAGLTCVMDCPAKLEQTRFQPEMEIALYRVAQEAVHNATRHGDANCISMRVRRFEQSLRLEITDDGSGFDPQSVLLHKGLGMKSMASRVEGLGGHLDMQSRPGETTIAIDVPWRVAYGTKAETSVGTVAPTKSTERQGRSPVPPGQGGAQ
jgi:two-component system NarL family sensor kinase